MTHANPKTTVAYVSLLFALLLCSCQEEEGRSFALTNPLAIDLQKATIPDWPILLTR